MLELRRDHVLDLVHERVVELQPAIRLQVTRGHQAQHFDRRQ